MRPCHPRTTKGKPTFLPKPTTDDTDAPLFRVTVSPNEGNGLRAISRLMADKLTTVPKDRMGERIGRLGDADMVRLSRAVLVFLGLA